jgi:hypothetical protein
MRLPLGITLKLAIHWRPGATPCQSRLHPSCALHRALGDQGADDLVNWMVKVEANRSQLNELMVAWNATAAQFGAVHARLDGIDRRLENMDRRITDLFKWSFVFWLGSVGVFAGLVRLMR